MRPQTVLLADDEPLVRESLRPLLEHGGYEVREASNGHETVRMAEEVSPDLVILDINMPDLNGYSVLLRLKSRSVSSDVPVIVLSGEFVGNEYEKHSQELGAVYHLEKPVPAGKLLSVIGRALRERSS